MNIVKVMNDYLLIKEIEKEKEKAIGGILLPDSVDLDTVTKGEVLMLPHGFGDGSGVKVGSKVIFYKGTGIDAGENLVVHINNILGTF